MKNTPAKKGTRSTPAIDELATSYKPPVLETAQKPGDDLVEKSGAESLLGSVGIVIEDGVALPMRSIGYHGKKRRIATDALGMMRVGQSFAVPAGMRHMILKVIRETHRAKTAAYTTRTDKSTRVMRVWREA